VYCSVWAAVHNSTIAGDGVAGVLLTNPMSVAVDSEGNIVFSDWSCFIRKTWQRDGALTIVAGIGILGWSSDGLRQPAPSLSRAIPLANASTRAATGKAVKQNIDKSPTISR
jgi:hypothetical protein